MYDNDYNSFYRPPQNDPWAKPDPPVIDVTPKHKPRRGLKVTALVLAGVLTVGSAFGIGYAAKNVFDGGGDQTSIFVSDRQSVAVKPVTVDGKNAMSYSELYATNVNSCVSINASATTNVFGQQAQTMASSGSGFIITQDGYIVTNYHVINGGDTVKVTLYDGTTYNAAIIGGDEDYDIAVLKVDATGLTPVVIGNSDALQVGDDVAAIGNPLGELTFSMSEGIVSTTNRLINVDGTPFNMIQITAAINSGNSGGPLFNLYGELIGIVSAKFSGSSSSSTTVEGLGFAIPINDVVAMIEDIMANGYISNKPYLAITGGTLQSGMVPGSTVTQGVYVYSVEEGGAAARAGLVAGDIITRIGEMDISTLDDITALKKRYSAGDTATVEYYRNNEKRTGELTFDKAPDSTVQPSADTPPDSSQTNPYNGADPWNEFFDYYFGNRGGSTYRGSAA